MIVFWLDYDRDEDGEPIFYHPKSAQYKAFPDTELTNCTKFMNELRKIPHISNVSLSTEFEGMVGLPGVDEVKDGKTPDGESYHWSKAHRAGADRKR